MEESSRDILGLLGYVPANWSDEVCDDVLDTLEVVFEDIKREGIG